MAKIFIEFNRKVEGKEKEFKEELWDIVVGLGEPILMGTGLNKVAREELLSKMIHIRERGRTLNLDPVRIALLYKLKKKVKTKSEDQDLSIIIASGFVIHKTREGEARVG